MTLQEKLQKLDERILQCEIDIEDKKQKLKNLKAEKKSLQTQIERNFAEQVAKQLMSQRYTEEQRQEILKKLTDITQAYVPPKAKTDTMSSFSDEKVQTQTSKNTEVEDTKPLP